MKAIVGAGLGALAAGGALILLQGVRASTSSAPLPILVNCGDGRQALVRPSDVARESVSQVECVPVQQPYDLARPVSYATGSHSVSPLPVIEREVVPVQRTVVYDRPRAGVVRRARASRDWKKSALIIGGSAAGGAGVGALIDGGSGAKKGAVVGGLAGVVYDLATRDGRR